MEMTIYEKDQEFVVKMLRQGEFDYIDGGDEVFESDFFRFINARGYLHEMAKTYPSPREKLDVPLWFFLSSDVAMRLHGCNAFHQYAYVVHSGGMLSALGPQVGTKAVHPRTGALTVSCPGFNKKNEYDRQTPCDQDFLRKMARDTDADELMDWYNKDVSLVFKKHKQFDPEGIFIGDASYLFVPDNEAYERSVVMLFDKHNHPVDSKEIPADKKGEYRWRRCYKMVSLLHTDRAGGRFVVAAVKVVPGNTHECPVLYDMVDAFVAAMGEGVIRRLILDRGFLDGEKISRCKLEHGIDVLIPLKRSMDIYQDALQLLPRVQEHFEPWHPPAVPQEPPLVVPKPERIRKRELKRRKTLEAKRQQQPPPPPPPDETVVASHVVKIPALLSWDTCPIPLHVVVSRETFADGHQDLWMLIDTNAALSPGESRSDYLMRARIEERHRQFKCFTDLQAFTSRAFSLVVNQVVFILLTYSLVQIYLCHCDSPQLNRKPPSRVRRQLLPAASYILIFCQGKVAFLDSVRYTDIILSLEGEARQKAIRKIKELKQQLLEALHSPRPP